MRFLKTYLSKVILTAFVGIQIPILTFTYYLCTSTVFFSQEITLEGSDLILILTIVSWADIVSTAIVTYILYYLLTPVDPVFHTPNIERGVNLPDNLQDTLNSLVTGIDTTLEKLEASVRDLIHYDNLTKLPNRELFQTLVKQAISKTGDHQQFALIVLDINSLKNINTTLGRQVGDLLLVKVAQRLSENIQSEDVLARFGGDEFIILRANITDSNCTIALSNKLLESLAEPFYLHGKRVHCDAKIGITIYPFDGVSVEQLLQNADTAIHQIKRQKITTYQFYSSAMSNELQRTLAIEEQLRYAIEKQELLLYYQPRIDLISDRVVAVEALLRWHNPKLGWVSPNEFIPIAEQTNLIMPIGEWALRNACLQNKQWQSQLSPIRVSVNISACQFQQKNLTETINTILNDTGLDTRYLELEVTESILLENLERTVSTLWELKRRGVSIALDDFGTGYSSLGYLQKLPLNTIKIDRSFVSNIVSNTNDAAISNAIVVLAKSLNLNITAEGVETEAQLTYLQNQGCNEVQGYYFSKPLPEELILDFLLAKA